MPTLCVATTKNLALTILALLLSACAAPSLAPPPAAAEPAPAALPPPLSGLCNQEAAIRFAVGRIVSPELLADIQTRASASIVRVLRPNQPTTLDYNGQRLTLVAGADDRITDARCG